MIYNDIKIRELIEAGNITGASPEQVNPASLNIRLGYSFLIPRVPQNVILGEEVEYDSFYLQGREHIWIMPGQFMLATTCESFKIPADVAAFVQGRSSIGRIGLMIQNAGFVDPGFKGHITLELKNDSQNPIDLIPGYPVGQMVFFQTDLVEHPYCGKYNGQIEATGSRMELDRKGRDRIDL